MALTGVPFGPVCHYYYIFLDRILPGTTMRILCKKILFDQLVFSPVSITMFLVSIGLLEGASHKAIHKDLVEKGPKLYKAECIVWPPVQMINFYFLPTRFRVLFDNTISLGFDWYYSYVKYRKPQEEIRDSYVILNTHILSQDWDVDLPDLHQTCQHH